MSEPTVEGVRQALRSFKDPENGRPLVEQDQLRDIRVEGDSGGGTRISLGVALTSYVAPIAEEVRQAVADRIQVEYPEAAVEVALATLERPPARLGETHLRCKSVIAVGSGKGGVGKSTVATNLAFALHQAGCKVGLLDADVYGPSVPHLTGTADKAGQIEVADGMMSPVMADGLAVMSIGYHLPPDQPVIWRGPMLHQSLTQLLNRTQWGELDYLIVDMPPGTGDVAITLSQAIPATGAVVVCTPQEVALLDAVKAIGMFRKVNIRILGMVENMSGFVAPDTGKRYDIFGSGGARRKAEELQVPFLGDIPIVLQIRERGDDGHTSQNLRDEATAPYYRHLAMALVRHLSRIAAQEPPRRTLPVL